MMFNGSEGHALVYASTRESVPEPCHSVEVEMSACHCSFVVAHYQWSLAALAADEEK